jgi:hypothetical protein
MFATVRGARLGIISAGIGNGGWAESLGEGERE